MAGREGRRYRMRGQVQGVGMRPFVFRTATELGLAGHVLNDSDGVEIVVGGRPEDLERFDRALREGLPPLARIDALHRAPTPAPPPGRFDIRASSSPGRRTATVTVDAATCADCLRELYDPSDRRYRHPLLNCTQCGPRFSLVLSVPYDRPHTTMAPFPLCAPCQAEYEDPGDRRHHAQPTCCHDCGPQLRGLARDGERVGLEALEHAAEVLAAGGLAVLKGLGGYHLAGLADRPITVARLRAVKARDGKPFAVMVPSVEAAERWVSWSESARAMARSPASPVVLAIARAEAFDRLGPGVMAETHRVGILLPHTPIQHLLAADPRLADRPIVMTSANLAEAPTARSLEDLPARWRAEVDVVLDHDRAIARRVDDSVVVDTGGPPLPVRRARGFAPAPLPLLEGADGIALGGDLKNVFGLARGPEAILSAHHGDLAHPAARAAFESEVEAFLRFFDVDPAFVACDLHPDFASSRLAARLASRLQVPLLEVQHHHAHAASLRAEHGVDGPLPVVVLDGFGLGDDGTAWGGELVVVDRGGYRRAATLCPVRAIGADRYAAEPGRPALAWLARALGESAADHPRICALLDAPTRRRLARLGPTHGVVSHSTGRLFDAAAALLGLAPPRLQFEAQAAMALEAAAARGRPVDAAPLVGVTADTVDPTALLRFLADPGVTSAEDAAASFHHRLAGGWAAAAARAASRAGAKRVGLSGGVAVNQTFVRFLREALAPHGLELLTHHQVPANDGGLALGQLAVARSQLGASGSDRRGTRSSPDPV